MWSLETSRGFESDKIAHLLIPYTRGRGLDLGCGQRKAWPHFIGVDSLLDYGGQRPDSVDVVARCDDLSIFGNESMDFVFSSHLLEHFRKEDVPVVLAEWSRVLKVGGYLALYLPSANFYPKCGEEGSNPDHKWDINMGDVETLLQEGTNCGWTQLECEERNQLNEYSIFEVYQKRDDGIFEKKLWQRNPDGKKRCLVIRYGAIGDQIVASSILPLLKEEGYYVTYSTTPDAQRVVLHNKNIDEFFIQDKDQVPNLQLGPYWEALKERYDKIVNLSESIEGTLLAIPGRINHEYSEGTRRKLLGTVNYLERTHDIADVPHIFDSVFKPTSEEMEWARSEKAKFDAPLIVWALAGSSEHKAYPFAQITIGWLLKKTPAHIYLFGDAGPAKLMQDTIIDICKKSNVDMDRLHGICGKWDIRQSLAFAQLADVVIGPETGVLNAVATNDEVRKIIYLSHSSQENITKHWKNTVAIEPENCPCYPCHRLHYGWENCIKVKETNAALCATNVKPERLFTETMNYLLEKAKTLQ